MILEDLRKFKNNYIWDFLEKDKLYTWIVKDSSGEKVGESCEKYMDLENCVLNASINGYSETIVKVEDSWVFYYKDNKGYKWQRIDNNEGEIISQSIYYFKDREECIKNANIFGF